MESPKPSCLDIHSMLNWGKFVTLRSCAVTNIKYMSVFQEIAGFISLCQRINFQPYIPADTSAT